MKQSVDAESAREATDEAAGEDAAAATSGRSAAPAKPRRPRRNGRCG